MRRNKANRPNGLDAHAVAKQAYDLYHQSSGATVNLDSGSLSGKDLWAVSVYRDRTQEVDESDVSVELIEAFIRANMDLLLQPQNSLGMWLTADEGIVYLDVSITVRDRLRALLPQDSRVLATGCLQFPKSPCGAASGKPKSDKAF